MHEERNLNRAHEKYLEYAPQEPIDAMRQKGENVIYMRVSDRKKGRSSAMRRAPMHGIQYSEPITGKYYTEQKL